MILPTSRPQQQTFIIILLVSSYSVLAFFSSLHSRQTPQPRDKVFHSSYRRGTSFSLHGHHSYHSGSTSLLLLLSSTSAASFSSVSSSLMWSSQSKEKGRMTMSGTAATSEGGGVGGQGEEEKGHPHANRLIHEKSPYLLQHAHNPVDWYPWGEEAFTKAKSLNRPIFLSSGYSTCKWCHVMAHESFESQRIAEILNSKFIPIKLDREERPDVDAIYMAFIQAATGGGGWPMSVFMTPDRRPFTGGTYFPEERFAGILQKVSDAWETKREEVEAQGNRVVESFRRELGSSASPSELSETEAETRIRTQGDTVMQAAYQQLNMTYDEARGGFGRSIKFPRPGELNFLMRMYLKEPTSTKGQRSLEMVLGTLNAMAMGGIHDHLGGGFHRYSTDPDWHIPHFEMMQYDVAQLLVSYVDAYKVTGEEEYAEVAHGIAGYVLRDTRDPAGGFYAAEDADSPDPQNPSLNKEGAFYAWTKAEVEEVLANEKEKDKKRFCQLFDIREKGNVKATADPHGELAGKNVLHLVDYRRLQDLSESDKGLIQRGKDKLFVGRSQRPRPHRDEKVLASWTGMAISALAKSMPLRKPEYLVAAQQAADFIYQHMYRPADAEQEGGGGTLSRCYFKGELSSVPGLADDYANVVRGLLDLYEALSTSPSTSSSASAGSTAAPLHYLDWAKALQNKMDELFLCRPGEGRGYLSVLRTDASIAYPVASTYDGAEPSATSVAVSNLLRLSAMTDDEALGRKAERLIAQALQEPATPYEAPELLSALSLYGPRLLQVIVVGPKGAEETLALAQVYHDRFLPHAVMIHHDPTAADQNKALLPEVARQCDMKQGKATAYVCQNRVCSLPITSPQALAERLDQGGVGGGRGRKKGEAREGGVGQDVASMLGGGGGGGNLKSE